MATETTTLIAACFPAFITIEGNKLMRSGVHFDFDDKKLGERAKEIIAAAGNLAEMIKREDASNLYLSLRIEI